MGRTTILYLALVLVTFLEPKATADIVFDPSADFSATSNPTGVWSYGSKSTSNLGGSSLSLYQNEQTYNGTIALWSPSAESLVPFVSKNLSASSSNDGATVWGAGQLVLHAGDGTASVVRFTATSNMSLNLEATYSNQAVEFSGTKVYLFQNGTQIFSDSLGGFGSTSVVSPRQLDLSTGDYLDFMVGPRADGSVNSTSTGLAATLTVAVPEPSTSVLFVIAGSFLFVIRKFRASGWAKLVKRPLGIAA